MLTLAAGDSLRGKATNGSAVSYVASLLEVSIASGEVYKNVQSQLGSTTTIQYTAPASTMALIREVVFTETTGVDQVVALFLNGTVLANRMAQFTIVANGMAVLTADGLRVYDSTGKLLTTAALTVNSVDNTILADMAQATVKGRAAGAGPGDPQDLSGAQLLTIAGAVPTTRLLTGTTPVQINGTTSGDLSADRIISILAATQALAGSMSASDKLKLDNIWTDANTVGILTSNTGAQNVTAFNAWYATAATFSTLYLSPGTYDFNAELTMARDIRVRFMGAGKGRTILRNTSATANLFNQTVAGFYVSFEELGFTASVTKTAGAAIIGASNNAYLDVRRCEFQNQFRSIDLLSGAANLGTLNEVIITNPSSTAGGSQVRINGAGINMMIQNMTLNVTGSDVIGVELNQCGAVQFSNCDLIGGRNTMLVNATGIISALYLNNVFCDQATFGSTVKFMGTFATSRVKFVQCGITTGGGSGLTALEVAGTGTGTGIPEALDFLLCDFYNNGFAGTTTGILATGVRGLDLNDCRISGFTFGVDLTPYSADGVTNFNLSGNTIGPTENFAGNGTGIRINAGAVKYGASSINYNDLSGNTTALTQNGNFVNNLLQLEGNFGLAVAQMPNVTATTIPLTTVTNVDSRGGLMIPAGVRPGTTVRITVMATNAATAQTLTIRVLHGINNTNADTQVDLFTLAAGTAAVGSALIVIDVFYLTATTALASIKAYNGNNLATGMFGAINGWHSPSAPVTISTAAASFLGVYFSSATASAVTIRSVAYEVVSQ